MNVLGDPVDQKGPVGSEKTLPIHRKPPSYEEQAGGNELLETLLSSIAGIQYLLASEREPEKVMISTMK